MTDNELQSTGAQPEETAQESAAPAKNLLTGLMNLNPLRARRDADGEEDGGKKKALKLLLDIYNNENNHDPLYVKF